MTIRNQVSFKVSGDYALFTDPVSKIGGEKSTLSVPTYQALKGICESIYWKPTIVWVVDQVKILNKIQTETKGIRPIKYGGGNDLAYYTYLKNPAYAVLAHFEFNQNRPDLIKDRNEHKHHNIAKRCIEKGGRRDIYMGVRECCSYVEPCDFEAEPSVYADMPELELGFMYHGLTYPDESGTEVLTANFWRPKLVGGIITFCRPEECPTHRTVRKMKEKPFTYGDNFQGLDEPGLWEEGVN